VLAAVATTFSKHGVSIEAVEQSMLTADGVVAYLEIGTHLASEAALAAVVVDLKASDAVKKVASVIRMEGL
jgi:homoserine dehydrogenase